MTWLHFSDREMFKCIHFLGGRKMTGNFRVPDFHLIMLEKEKTGLKHLMIVDGTRDYFQCIRYVPENAGSGIC